MKKDCLRTRRLAGRCQKCGESLGEMAHLPLKVLGGPMCARCCPCCRVTAAEVTGEKPEVEPCAVR